MKGLEQAWRCGAGLALAGLVLAMPEVSSGLGWAQTPPSPPAAADKAPAGAPPFAATTQVLSVEVPVQV
ncbi:MAG: hypothetical protein WAM82_31360, partial [Thermoanaerobaculia bacterium]